MFTISSTGLFLPILSFLLFQGCSCVFIVFCHILIFTVGCCLMHLHTHSSLTCILANVSHKHKIMHNERILAESITIHILMSAQVRCHPQLLFPGTWLLFVQGYLTCHLFCSVIGPRTIVHLTIKKSKCFARVKCLLGHSNGCNLHKFQLLDKKKKKHELLFTYPQTSHDTSVGALINTFFFLYVEQVLAQLKSLDIYKNLFLYELLTSFLFV